MFKKKVSEEEYLIELCEESGLVLIKENFKGQHRYLVKSGDETLIESHWADRGPWADIRDDSTIKGVERWMKTNHVEVTTEILVP